MEEMNWKYPGARWWKIDFHAHTPASNDTAWQNHPLQPQQWLMQFMAAGIDGVVVTDHNTGAWIDVLKEAYEELKAEADAGSGLEGFRPLMIFPGVEISVSGGVHILAVLEPEAGSADVHHLLGAVGLSRKSEGCTDDETSKSPAEVVGEIGKAGALPILAHVDQPTGLATDSVLVQEKVLAEAGLAAVELGDREVDCPVATQKAWSRLTRVLGSDCHSFRGEKVPGSRYTWVKMERLSMEGLRLALLDGNGVSVMRSNEAPSDFSPFRVPEHFISAITVKDGRFLGRETDGANLALSPFFNVLIGGRGTGKSSFVHALRLAMKRGEELERLGKDSQPKLDFDRFKASDSGALTPQAEIEVVWQQTGRESAVRWQAQTQESEVLELTSGEWQATPSQSLSDQRFPLRIFSQGQIAALADKGRRQLLSLIDAAAGMNDISQQMREKVNEYFALRAKERSQEAKVSVLPETKRQLDLVNCKLSAFSAGQASTVLTDYARMMRQRRDLLDYRDHLLAAADELEKCSQGLLPDDWTDSVFPTAEAGVLQWRKTQDKAIECFMRQMQEEADRLRLLARNMPRDAAIAQWDRRSRDVEGRYQALQTNLAKAGVTEPDAFARLTQEKQLLEVRQRQLIDLTEEKVAVAQRCRTILEEITALRRQLTQGRQNFLQNLLANNDYVRIQVVPMGFDAAALIEELRSLLDLKGDVFADDLLQFEGAKPAAGLLKDWVNNKASFDAKMPLLTALRDKVLHPDGASGLGGRFKNRLKDFGRPEQLDRVAVWFPEDDLDISYKRGTEWTPVSQGSQGQRSSALLAFLLSFGKEPLVLDQPEDDLDNHLIYDLIVRQIRENKLRRQLLIVTHNPNIVVNGDAEEVHVMAFGRGQCYVKERGSLQEPRIRDEVCRIMEGGHDAFERRWKRLGQEH